MTDAQYIKKVRDQLGLTQAQMAERLGYGHQKDISNIERGATRMSNQARAHLKTIEKISKLKEDIKDSFIDQDSPDSFDSGLRYAYKEVLEKIDKYLEEK